MQPMAWRINGKYMACFNGTLKTGVLARSDCAGELRIEPAEE
jgi:hypothetical protein